MMRFKTFIAADDARAHEHEHEHEQDPLDQPEHEQLDESILRTGALTTYASKARQAGNNAEQAFKAAKSELRRPLPEDTIEARIDVLNRVLDKLLEGLLHQREQIGNSVAVAYTGHALASRRSRKSR